MFIKPCLYRLVETPFLTAGTHPNTFYFGKGGADREAIYNSCFILKIMLQKSCHCIKRHLYTYKHNHVFHNPLTQFKSQGLIFFVLQVHLEFSNFPILIFKIPMY